MAKQYKKYPFRMLYRLMYLFFTRHGKCGELVNQSYNNISASYDIAWTNHMRDITESLIGRLNLQKGDKAADLACGTGFATGLIAGKISGKVIGVDASKGMLEQAEKNYGDRCEFINRDIVEFLAGLPDESLDLVTCCWGLGYSKPFSVLKQIKRVLKKGGRVGIVDNSIFSLREVLYCSFLTFMEQPEKLTNLMRFRFLMLSGHLGFYFRVLGMKTAYLSDGSKSYNVESGKAAIDRLISTGAAAGFEYAACAEDKEQIFERFAEIIEQKYMGQNGIKITHRYLAGIATK